MHAVLGVHHEQADFGALHRTRGAERRIELEILFDLAALAKTGGVDENELAALILERRIDGIARRPRLGGDDEPFLAEQLVHEARLADVGPADDGDMDGLCIFGLWSLGQ